MSPFPAASITPSTPRATPHVVVVMGVSGTGKTSVGQRLAADLGWEYVEGDAHHPQANIDKMTAGVALSDEDRMPWLRALADLAGEAYAAGRSTVLTRWRRTATMPRGRCWAARRCPVPPTSTSTARSAPRRSKWQRSSTSWGRTADLGAGRTGARSWPRR